MNSQGDDDCIEYKNGKKYRDVTFNNPYLETVNPVTLRLRELL